MKFIIATVAALGISAPAFAGSLAPIEEVIVEEPAAAGSLSPALIAGGVALLLLAATQSDSSSGT